MKYKAHVPPQYVRDSLEYDPDTGEFRWKVRADRSDRWNAAWSGQIAGSGSQGYWLIQVKGQIYGAHRLAWVIVHGEWPDREIDHIDGNGQNNRIANLRLATRSQNMANTRKKKRARSGVTGVTYHRQSGKWQARVGIAMKSKYLGLFETIEEAVKARDEAARLIHGEFAKPNS